MRLPEAKRPLPSSIPLSAVVQVALVLERVHNRIKEEADAVSLTYREWIGQSC